MDVATLTRSVTGGGVRYLELFLQEYTSIFSGPVNPSCPACLTTYLTKYKNHFNAMANTCTYRLHAKYENIPLQFGSAILVNNANITNEYAAILLQQPNGERFFAVIPSAEELAEAETVEQTAALAVEEPHIEVPSQDDDDILLEDKDPYDFETVQPE